MDRADLHPPAPSPEYAATCIDFAGGGGEACVGSETQPRTEPDDQRDPERDPERDLERDLERTFIETGAVPLEPEPEAVPVELRLGLAVLRLRLYRGWSQVMLERVSGVDQTLISRFERGKVPGLAMRRLYAILTALRAEEITFGPGPLMAPQSSWEDAMYGDLWERAGRIAEARFNRRRSA
jgi:transcriptional regulator with XRE-family HTH domain